MNSAESCRGVPGGRSSSLCLGTCGCSLGSGGSGRRRVCFFMVSGCCGMVRYVWVCMGMYGFEMGWETYSKW